jgi:hypothetical protein
MTDSAENEVSLEHKVTICHYLCCKSQRPPCSFSLLLDPTSASSADSTQSKAVCVGIFVIKRDTHLHPSFRDIAALRQIRPPSSSHSSSSPLLLLMLSVPRIDPQTPMHDLSWIYPIRRVCFTYTPPSSSFSSSSLCTAQLINLTVPSITPDLAQEFASATCLHTSSSSSSCASFSSARHRQGGEGGGQVAGMGGLSDAGLTQVVQTELLTINLLDAAKVIVNSACVCAGSTYVPWYIHACIHEH